MTIRKLSVQLANQIAAGEVVERQASVIKELLENAVDAGGDSIVCEVESAGRVMMRVRDNGCGIPADELPLALAPHATSKIATAEDLSCIMTLGFRGEALASIAAVSKLTLTSKTPDEVNGYSVEVEGPAQDAIVAPAAHPNGTTVEVRELFFNTPARRRFLKADKTEMLRIKDVFVRCALAHPEVGFELVSDGRSLVKVKGVSDDLSLRMRRLGKLIGGDYEKDGIAVRGESPLLKISGMLLPPPLSYETVQERIYLFLNNRPIADKIVIHAIKEAFFGILKESRQVRCVLYLSCDPSEVDVNVHPRKDEVRFHDARVVHDIIVQTLQDTLQRAGVGEAQVYQSQDSAPLKDKEESLAGEHLNPPADNSSGSAVSKSGTGLSSISPAAQAEPQQAYPSGAGFFSDIGSISEKQGFMDSEQGSPHDGGSQQSRPARAVSGYIKAPVSQDERQSMQRSFGESISAENITDGADLVSPHKILKTSQEFGVLAEISAKSLLISKNDRFFILNLPKARQIYEADCYITKFQQSIVETIKLAMPFSIKIDKKIINFLKKYPEILKKLGFLVKFSTNMLVFEAIPANIKGTDLAGLLPSVMTLVVASVPQLLKGECPVQLANMIAGQKKSSGDSENIAEAMLSRIAELSLNDFLNLYKEACTDLRISETAAKMEKDLG